MLLSPQHLRYKHAYSCMDIYYKSKTIIHPVITTTCNQAMLLCHYLPKDEHCYGTEAEFLNPALQVQFYANKE